MADEKTPEELEVERVRLMTELENEDSDIAKDVAKITPPDPPQKRIKKNPNPPREFKEVDYNGPSKTVKKDDTVLILVIIAAVAIVVFMMWTNYQKGVASNG